MHVSLHVHVVATKFNLSFLSSFRLQDKRQLNPSLVDSHEVRQACKSLTSEIEQAQEGSQTADACRSASGVAAT